MGVLFDLDAALALRAQIDGLVRDEYLTVIDDIIREYPDAVAADARVYGAVRRLPCTAVSHRSASAV
jgi:hypothetical protein